jgi:endogenous inhibitor of DNA gyrase (YacG/DUF329 family)
MSAPECLICGKPWHARFKPFCSRRCADLDLGQWLKGSYAIPGSPADDDSAPETAKNDPDED